MSPLCRLFAASLPPLCRLFAAPLLPLRSLFAPSSSSLLVSLAVKGSANIKNPQQLSRGNLASLRDLANCLEWARPGQGARGKGEGVWRGRGKCPRAAMRACDETRPCFYCRLLGSARMSGWEQANGTFNFWQNSGQTLLPLLFLIPRRLLFNLK
jgi:hypothetical protein